MFEQPIYLACHTNYHHNFHVNDGVRTYYDGIPDVIQVGEHQFVERRVVQLWTDLMLVAWCVDWLTCTYYTDY
jgi:hypothetical protein